MSSTDHPGRLVARSRPVDGPLDLVELAGPDGVVHLRGAHGLGGRGVALRCTASDAPALLAAIEVDDEVRRPGTGAVAFGALPFRADATTELLVPEVLWGVDADGAWVTTVGPPGAGPVPEPTRPAREVRATAGPGEVRAMSVRHPDAWCDLVARATAHLRAAPPGGLSKVVLAREVLVEADAPFDRTAVLANLAITYPHCHLFLIDGFLGASPELLVERSGMLVRAQPMAGTAPRGADPDRDAALAAALLGSTTYRREHQITIDMVYDTLLPWCSYLDYEAEPSIVAVANVQHLATLVEGRLSQPAPSVLELVAALHPTPAVSGWPRDEATAWILRHEGFDRGRYAGAVGWVDAAGNGTWAVSIRCAEVEGRRARVFAGNGIVSSSDPRSELAETEAKLDAMLRALRG